MMMSDNPQTKPRIGMSLADYLREANFHHRLIDLVRLMPK